MRVICHASRIESGRPNCHFLYGPHTQALQQMPDSPSTRRRGGNQTDEVVLRTLLDDVLEKQMVDEVLNDLDLIPLAWVLGRWSIRQ